MSWAPWQRLIAIAAGLGFASSLCVHIAARAGYEASYGETAQVLFMGVFVVWFPTVLYMRRFNREFGRGLGFKAWKVVVTGAPPWLVYLAGAAFVYALINFFTAVSFDRSDGSKVNAGFGILATGHAMAFYAAAAVINWAAVRRREEGIEWVCERGHSLSPSDKFCPECGAAAKRSPSAQ